MERLSEDQIKELARIGLSVDGPVSAEVMASVDAQIKLRQLIGSGLSPIEVARLLNIGPGEVDAKIAERAIFSIPTPNGPVIPGFQFAQSAEGTAGLIEGLSEVFPHIRQDLHPVGVVNYLTLPDSGLLIEERPVSPVVWLKAGNSPEPIIAVAQSL